MEVSIPIKLQQYLIKKINFDTIAEMIENFSQYSNDIEQLIDCKIQNCSKQMSKREENIHQIMGSIKIAEEQKSEQNEYESIYEAFVRTVLLEYKSYKKIKKGYINLTLLKYDEAFWDG